MHVSLNWLKDFVDIPKDLDPKDLGGQLTLKTAEVEGVHKESEQYANMVVGQIKEIHPHPNADKLRLTKTDVGEEIVQIVCGGANLQEGMYVAVALPGSQVRWHGEGDLVKLEKTKIRGEESFGMICAANEIGLNNPSERDHDITDLGNFLNKELKAGTPLAEALEKDDILIEFDNKSLTHRPDLWGHYGIAREIAAITDKKLKAFSPEVNIPEKGEQIDVNVEIPELCPRYCGLIIDNIKVEASPDWLTKRLKASGHGAHNNIVDITNYVMSELGQPMHAFDKNFIKGGIVVRTAKKGEKITTLDGKEKELNELNLVIADHEKAVAVAGVIGGENSGINKNTSSIILESANFQPGSVRKTSVKLGIRTDSVQRFEKALDPRLAELAMKRAAELILQICPGAKIAGPITDIKNFDEKELKLELNTEKAASKIGVELNPKEIKEILEKLEFKVEEKTKTLFTVTVPSFRATKDVTIEDDLIEEIARMYGYDNIPPTLPSLPTKLPMENRDRFKKHRVRELFAHNLGFDEVYNYSFYGKQEMKNCLMSEENHLKLLNYLSEDQTHMRKSLIPNILKNIQVNIKNFDQFKFFEIGRTYKEDGNFMPLEEKNICGAIVKKGKSDETFYEAKGAVEAVFTYFNLPKLDPVQKIEAPYAHPSKGLTYLDEKGVILAKVFMLHPQVAKNHDLENYSIALFKINFTELLKHDEITTKYRKIPKLPALDIDISVVVSKNTEIAKLQEAIQKADKELIQNISLFDIYEGDKIEQDKKAVAFKVTLQASDRTLTDEEMSKIQKQIFKNLEALGGSIRGK